MESRGNDRRGLLRLIPQVNELLEYVAKEDDATDIPRQVLVDAARSVLNDTREAILSGRGSELTTEDLELESLSTRVRQEAKGLARPGFRRLVNATGVVLHTNIGRSPLSRSAMDAVMEVSGGYCNLEYRLDEGERGSRQEHLEPLIRRLTGAEAAMVVNNNAAATLLVLTALARNREVIVSRGELIEIGDSFRLPDIMAESGARLVEVGTTNRTRLSDYANAINPETAILMKIHKSNYRITGYAQSVALEELVELGLTHYVPVVHDLGSGCLLDMAGQGLEGEPTALRSIASGAALVTFSGDKLLGGPQAGLIAGASVYLDSLRKHPLARALRVGKMTVAALQATLIQYLDAEEARGAVPALRMLTEPVQVVKKRANRLKRLIGNKDAGNLDCRLIEEFSRAGGGSLPTSKIPTYCLSISHSEMSAEALDEGLRNSDPAVLARVHEGRILLDLRTVLDEEVPVVAGIVASL